MGLGQPCVEVYFYFNVSRYYLVLPTYLPTYPKKLEVHLGVPRYTYLLQPHRSAAISTTAGGVLGATIV